MGEVCYLCGSTKDMTRDHIPPEGFFPPDAKENLITVPCCFRCNNSFTLDDEATRLWLASCRPASDQAKWIWENKVLDTLARSPKLKAHIQQHVKVTYVPTPTGLRAKWTISFPVDRWKPFAIRICKGLLRKFHPNYDYSKAGFLMRLCNPESKEDSQLLSQVLPCLYGDSRGKSVFKFWHGLNSDNPNEGIIVLLFYEASCWLVSFGHDDRYNA
jgi:hypothetical protein